MTGEEENNSWRGVAMTKEEARSLMKKRRGEMEAGDRTQQNKRIRKRILGDEAWQNIFWFYPFASYGTEVDTRELIQYVLTHEICDHRVSVALPRVEKQEMDFYEITSMDELCPGYHGILEPDDHCPKVEATEGLMLLPGLAFDEKGHRVGYGGGYYDRYLGTHPTHRLLTWGVAYDFQMVETLEAEQYDICPQRIITPFHTFTIL